MTGSDDSGADKPYVCNNCGEDDWGPLIGGECVRKCSESVPIAELEQLADEWDEKAQAETFSDYESGVNAGIELVVDELQELIADYTDE